MIKTAIAGASGRMGRTLITAILSNSKTSLTLATEHPNSEFLGVDSGALAGTNNTGVTVQSKLSNNFDILIDFTRPQVTLANLEYCVQNNKKIIIGTTGFTDEQKQILCEAAKKIPIVFAANFSLGINLCFKLVEVAAEILGSTSDIEIIEAHHRHKVDSPSGTALALGEVIANTLGRNLKDNGVFAREGIMPARQQNDIGFATIRAGDIVGEHTALFADNGERLEITHKASSRMTFANGAIKSAIWLADKNPGLYSMQDVLGFNDELHSH